MKIKNRIGRMALIAAVVCPMAYPVGVATARTPGIPSTLSPTAGGYMARASQFFDAGMWRAAADQLGFIVTGDTPLSAAEEQQLLFMLGVAYAQTDSEQCLRLIDEYISRYAANPDSQLALLSKADFLFYAGRYSEALENYNRTDYDKLPSTQLAGATYRRALSMIKCGFFAEARPLMISLAKDAGYGRGALYYDAWLDYQEGKYDEAYKKFASLDNQPVSRRDTKTLSRRVNYTSDGIEPGYYMVQIDYLKGRYQDAVDRALTLLKKTPVKELADDTGKVLGMSFYRLGRYQEALPWLEDYVAESGSSAYCEAVYALGVIKYSMGEKEEALKLFSTLTDYRDAIGQSAWLYIGQTEASHGDDNAAAMAFEKASRMSFDRNVSRTALYNYVTARTRGGNIPFGTSVDLLESFLQEYPDSEQAPAVEEYLAVAYFNNKDYSSALRNIDRIARPSVTVQQTKQKILYELGMQQLNSGDTQQAITSFTRAVALGNVNKDLKAQAALWLGDAYFDAGDWKNASDAYTTALAGRLGANTPLAQYGKGYALMRLNRFADARKFFSQALDSGKLPAALSADARMRIADCKLYSGNTREAAADFKTLASNPSADVEYAAWRHARILGLNGDTEAMTEALVSLAGSATGQYLPQILSDLTSVLLSEGKREQAVPYLRRTVAEYPTTQAASAANDELRLYYASTGKLDEYARYLDSLHSPFAMTRNEMEELEFQAAADDFNNSATDIAKIEKFVADYPASQHIAEAWSMLARGLEAAGDSAGALKAYTSLEELHQPAYRSLTYPGIMRHTADPSKRLEYARQVQRMGGQDADIYEEARFYEASALSELGKETEARAIWSDLAPNTSTQWGARSAVALGESLIKAGKPAEAEKILTAFVDAGTPFSYWLARGYIALSDALSALGKKYMARQYLESLRANYPGKEDDIRNMINNRLK